MYHVFFTKKALKEIKGLDKQIQKLLLNWIYKHLDGCVNPYNIPNCKILKGNKKEYVRYRVGKYRTICFIKDDKLVIEIISVGHKKRNL